uniref:Gag protein n=1 Tax=Solanum tuberosum TaxID=4113 RepID=M1DSM5_SOLTU
MRAMDVRMMISMGAMMIAMIKRRMKMRATIPEENMTKMVNIDLMHPVEAPMVMREHMRDPILTPRVKMFHMMMPEHDTLPTLRMKVSSSSQSHSMGRRECAILRCKDTTSYTSQRNAHLSGYGNRGRYEGCVKDLHTKMIDFPIFEGRRDPEAYLDWEWQCEQTFQIHDLRGQDRPLYSLFHLKGFALGWWTQEERLLTLQGNTHPLTWEELKRLIRFRYEPKRYLMLIETNDTNLRFECLRSSIV